jgi:YD repeat-containing protein
LVEEHLSHNSLGHLEWRVETTTDGSAPERRACYHIAPEGRIEGVMKSDGTLVESAYDDAGRVVEVRAGRPLVDPVWAVTCKSAWGVPQRVVDVTGVGHMEVLERYSYDSGGWPTRAADGSGIGIDVVVDGFGRVIEEIDGEGRRSRLGYDALGRVAWQAVYSSTASPYRRPQSLEPELQAMAEYVYDRVDRLTRIDRWNFAQGKWLQPAKRVAGLRSRPAAHTGRQAGSTSPGLR